MTECSAVGRDSEILTGWSRVASDFDRSAIQHPPLAIVGLLANAAIRIIRQPPSGPCGDRDRPGVVVCGIVQFTIRREFQHSLHDGDVTGKRVHSAKNQCSWTGFHNATYARKRRVDSSTKRSGFDDHRSNWISGKNLAASDQGRTGSGNKTTNGPCSRVVNCIALQSIVTGRENGRCAIHPSEGVGTTVRISSPLGTSVPSAAAICTGTDGRAIHVV